MSLLLLFKVGSTYTETGSGTVTTSGAASYNATLTHVVSGGGTVTLSGTANPKYIAAPAAPTGGAVLSGTADPDYIATPAIGGLAIASNGAEPTAIYTPAVSGGIALSGNANPSLTSIFVVGGTATTSGSASPVLISLITPSGGVVLSGVADGTYYPAGGGGVEYTRTGAGVVTISGTAPFELVPVGGLSAGHGGAVRYADVFRKSKPSKPSKDASYNIEKVADLLRVDPVYTPAPIPPTITVIDSVAYISFAGVAKTSVTKSNQAARVISLFGEALPTRSLTPRPSRKNGFSGSARVSFAADFDDDDIEQIAAWLLTAN